MRQEPLEKFKIEIEFFLPEISLSVKRKDERMEHAAARARGACRGERFQRVVPKFFPEIMRKERIGACDWKISTPRAAA